MLIHICCSVDSHYFLQKIREKYPKEKLIGFFYNPNIHPYLEYYLRLLDVKRSCKMLDIKLIEGEHDIENWLNSVKGLENEPEKGSRCGVCFDRRFEISAKKTREIGEEVFTSTLLTSPKKSLSQLKLAGDRLALKEGVEFIAPDFRKASGTEEQNILAKRDSLYRQDYCGCMFALNIQRDQQNKIADELFSLISNQIQPESIEERIEMYENRLLLESQNISYKIIKQRFLNWRLISGLLKVKKEITSAHFLPYSTLKSTYTRGKIDYKIDNIHYMNRDEVRFITLESYNEILQKDYKSIKELIFNPPTFYQEVQARAKLGITPYDLSLIVVVQNIPISKIEILFKSKTYSDVKEVLIQL